MSMAGPTVPVQPFVLPHGPTHEVVVDASENRIQHGLVEAPVIVDPPLHDRIDHSCQVRERQVTAPVDPPGANLPFNRLSGVATDRRGEVDEESDDFLA